MKNLNFNVTKIKSVGALRLSLIDGRISYRRIDWHRCGAFILLFRYETHCNEIENSINSLISLSRTQKHTFVVDLYPLSGGKQLLSTPRFLRNLFADDANYNRQQAQGNAPHSANTNNGGKQRVACLQCIF